MNIKTNAPTREILPVITISSLDLERIENLLESAEYKNMPGIEALQEELHRANVIDPADVPVDLVTMNSRVLFSDEATGEKHALTLVYPSPNLAPGDVSILAPVGSALLGLTVGQSIEWEASGRRKLRLRVLEVVSQPEASGQFHR